MATPNYGNQMGMQPQHPGMPMQQGPGMGPPQGAMPPPRPVRRGTSKAVPIVMSAGLAVGVFCGLLFGLGTGNDGALASTGGHGVTTQKADDTEVAAVLKTPSAADGTAKKVEPTLPQIPKAEPAPAAGSNAPAPAAGSNAPVPAAGSNAPVPAAGSNAPTPAAAGSGSGSGAGSATPAVVADKAAAKLKIEISPATETAAKITVDGKDFTPDMTVALDGAPKKTVAIVVKATGFHEYDQKVDVTRGETIVKVELVKRAGGAGTTPVAAGATPAGTHTGGNTGTTRPTWTGTQTVPAGGNPTGGTKSNGNSGGTKANGGTKSNGGKQPGKGSGLIDI